MWFNVNLYLLPLQLKLPKGGIAGQVLQCTFVNWPISSSLSRSPSTTILLCTSISLIILGGAEYHMRTISHEFHGHCSSCKCNRSIHHPHTLCITDSYQCCLMHCVHYCILKYLKRISKPSTFLLANLGKVPSPLNE